ncbi:MAG: tRNA (adenosine(37)-N6)-threonylcarbamoyltransferase complex ATPase subunit type 1 TsaE [Clostridia bacterium]
MKKLSQNNMEIYFNNIFGKDNISTFNYMYTTNNCSETIEFGKTLAKFLNICDVVVLNGKLGSGKTVLMSGIAKYFNILSQVSSPTFTIVNEYLTTDLINIYHFDVYRINSCDDFLDEIGTEYFSTGICIIEWGNIIKDILPKNTVYIDILKDDKDEQKRSFRIWRN